jgi:hypothetical protein
MIRRLRVLPLGVGLMLATMTLAACGGDDVTPPPENEPPTITLTAPSASAAYSPGSNLTIEWMATDDDAVVGVDLSYTADGNKSGTITTGATGSSYSWALPAEPLFGVVVTATATDAEGLTATDMTDNLFAVVEHSERGYVTSETCRTCHADKAQAVFQSGHPYKLSKVVDGQPPTYPFSSVPGTPQGFSWSDVSYVIGGYGWKARFIDNDGYILVTGLTGVPVQYNLPRTDLGVGPEWVDYHASDTQPKPYTCGTCHTTGWQTLAENGGVNQDGLPGMHGTWEEPGITCEACHGAGVDHVASKDASQISVDTNKELCGSCHFRDTNHGILASGGFIRHHEQYDELISAGHSARSCIDCHDPHIGTRYGHAASGGITVTCESCHADKTTNNHLTAVDCVTCHMPRATKSARAVNSYMGDLKTHIFKINASAAPKDAMWYTGDEGATFSRGFVTLDFVCYQCHKDENGVGGSKSMKSMADLSARATGIHN